jgi:hypothetical protein
MRSEEIVGDIHYRNQTTTVRELPDRDPKERPRKR